MRTIYKMFTQDDARVKMTIKRILTFLDMIEIDQDKKSSFRKLILDEINSLVRDLKDG